VDAQQESFAQDEVQLGRLHRLAGQREHDDVDEAVRDLDLRPLVALQDVLGDERVESQRFCDGGNLFGVR
jgi:hypothetical protein